MRRLFLFPLITVAVLGARLPGWTQSTIPQTPSRSYVGLKYLDLPSGLEGRNAWLLGLQPKNGDFSYTVSQVNDKHKGMVWLNRFLGRDRASGKAEVLVVDVIELPMLTKTQVFMGNHFCSQYGKRDENLMAIVQATNTPRRTKIYHAWKVNRAKEKIEAISTKGIVCENPSGGT